MGYLFKIRKVAYYNVLGNKKVTVNIILTVKSKAKYKDTFDVHVYQNMYVEYGVCIRILRIRILIIILFRRRPPLPWWNGDRTRLSRHTQAGPV